MRRGPWRHQGPAPIERAVGAALQGGQVAEQAADAAEGGGGHAVEQAADGTGAGQGLVRGPAVKQRGRRQAEGLGHAQEGVQPWPDAAALQPADRVQVDVGLGGQVELRQALALPRQADPVAEDGARGHHR